MRLDLAIIYLRRKALLHKRNERAECRGVSLASDRVTVRHAQLGHPIQGRALDSRFDFLPLEGPALELLPEDRLESHHGRLDQAPPMVTRLLLPAL